MKKFDTVIFDLGGVLIDWNPDYVYKTIFNDETKMREFYSEICTSEWNEEQDAGRGLKEATEELVARYPHEEKNIRAYYDRWEEMLKGEIEGTVQVLEKLKDREDLKLYALTNWSHETFPVALKRFEFLQWFHGRLVSGEEKMRKPFVEIYELLLKRYHINADTAVYIDDNERNLKPARELGLQSIHFKSPHQLEEELKNLGIL
jgi:2-haloacid dehalogenase